VKNKYQFIPPHLLVYCSDAEHNINGCVQDANKHKANQHNDEFTVVQQTYTIGDPPAIMIIPSNGQLVQPGLVRTLWQHLVFALWTPLQLPRISQCAVCQGSKCHDIEDENWDRKEKAGLSNELVQSWELERKHATCSKHC